MKLKTEVKTGMDRVPVYCKDTQMHLPFVKGKYAMLHFMPSTSVEYLARISEGFGDAITEMMKQKGLLGKVAFFWNNVFQKNQYFTGEALLAVFPLAGHLVKRNESLVAGECYLQYNGYYVTKVGNIVAEDGRAILDGIYMISQVVPEGWAT